MPYPLSGTGDGGVLAPGTQVGRYVIEREIGTGGMGVIYAARDPELDRVVAVKLLRGDGDRRTHDRLRREAQTMAQLAHPNVIAVYDVGTYGDRMFIAMEHVIGDTLARWLATPRSPREILDAYRAAGSGLAAAHTAGIVHRDFKPDNVLISGGGRVRVVDFGLARAARTVDPRMDAKPDADDGDAAEAPVGAPMPLSAEPRSVDAAISLTASGTLVGTPYYIAPELYGGADADARSDQFSFCVALFTALYGVRPFDGDGIDALAANVRAGRVHRIPAKPRVSRRIRAAILRGLAVDPQARFASLDELLAVLLPPRRWRTWAIGVVCAAAAAAVVAGLPSMGRDDDDGHACDPDPPALIADWESERRDALTRALIEKAPSGFTSLAERIVADLDTQRQETGRALADACKAARAREITWQQHRTRASCLHRKMFELTAVVDVLLELKPDLLTARDRLDAMASPNECVDMIAAPLADAAAAEALWRRYARGAILAVPTRNPELITELTAVAAEATQVGETELTARSTRWLGVAQRFSGELAIADETMQRAYRLAVELHATTLTARILSDRASIALLRDDAVAARSYVDLAIDIADNDTTAPSLRAQFYQRLAQAISAQGDRRTALEHLRHALALLKAHQIVGGAIDFGIRESLLVALAQLDDQAPGAMAVALETAELVRAQVGEVNWRYAVALNSIAVAASTVNDFARAIAYRRKSIEVYEATFPAGHAMFPDAHVRLAFDLYNAGDLEAAQREITVLKSLSAKYVRQKSYHEGLFARVAFELGRLDDGLALAIQALEGAISEHGKHDPRTLDLRTWIAGMQLESHQLDDAARSIAAAEDGYRAKPDANRLRLLRLRGTLAAELAIARGKPLDAEAAARHALSTADEVHASDRDRAHFHASLGKSLVAQRRWAEARIALDTSLALLGKTQGRRDDIAAVEIELAIVEAGLGETVRATARARRARAVLDDYPGRLRARAQADRLLHRRSASR